ncbi:LLM class flavin-dependent oxidoreductase [Streptomyces sp. RKAG293]|uniref:LLM class flavin-dependent oxidoreductase n=1 Tax=Streptomyces sp. RKAG293 TaxID=2893403 RepID=UPI002033C82B|nr:LLM class flavin-dependent oxidoreductase [Streptomyces sp. RKAG293]MCM2418541.1 LLM class flavin-dependent oxidoreductase [Streptomyces sp. RKAG293]
MPEAPPGHRPIRPLHLAFAIDARDQHREPHQEPHQERYEERYEASSYIELARLAERGALDFVTLDDSPAAADGSAGGLDALAVLAQVAPATDRIGLVAAVTATHPGTVSVTVQAALAALDQVSRGRAGWTPLLPDAWAADAEALLGDGWADAAGFPDVASAGPGPLEGWPVLAVDATSEAPRETAARHADVAYVRVGGPHSERLAYEARTDLRRRAAAYGRDPDRLTVLASLAVELFDPADAVLLADLFGDWHRDGITDGFHVRPADPRRDLTRLVNATVPVLQQRGLFRRFQPGTTLREHLGLDRPVSRSVTVR